MNTTGELVTRFFVDHWNKGDASVAAQILAPDFREIDPAHPESAPGSHHQEKFLRYRAAFPDLHYTETERLEAGDRVISRWTALGTHHGDLDGLPATDRPVRIEGISIFRSAAGLLTEHVVIWDTAGMLRQLTN